MATQLCKLLMMCGENSLLFSSNYTFLLAKLRKGESKPLTTVMGSAEGHGVTYSLYSPISNKECERHNKLNFDQGTTFVNEDPINKIQY